MLGSFNLHNREARYSFNRIAQTEGADAALHGGGCHEGGAGQVTRFWRISGLDAGVYGPSIN
jgi:hypothetical protein